MTLRTDHRAIDRAPAPPCASYHGGLPSYHLLVPDVDLHRWHPKTPYLRQRLDGRQVARLCLTNPLLVELGLPESERLYVLDVESLSVVELQPADDNALDQKLLQRGGLRTGKLLGERRTFPGVRLLHEEIVTAEHPDKGLPGCFGDGIRFPLLQHTSRDSAYQRIGITPQTPAQPALDFPVPDAERRGEHEVIMGLMMHVSVPVISQNIQKIARRPTPAP